VENWKKGQFVAQKHQISPNCVSDYHAIRKAIRTCASQIIRRQRDTIQKIIKVKIKIIYLILRPLVKKQRRSGMARIVKGFHSFTCTPKHLSTNGMNQSCFHIKVTFNTTRLNLPLRFDPYLYPDQDILNLKMCLQTENEVAKSSHSKYIARKIRK